MSTLRNIVLIPGLLYVGVVIYANFVEFERRGEKEREGEQLLRDWPMFLKDSPMFTADVLELKSAVGTTVENITLTPNATTQLPPPYQDSNKVPMLLEMRIVSEGGKVFECKEALESEVAKNPDGVPTLYLILDRNATSHSFADLHSKFRLVKGGFIEGSMNILLKDSGGDSNGTSPTSIEMTLKFSRIKRAVPVLN